MNPQAAPWLFVSYGGGHVKALLPVARRARELGLAQPVYLALTTAAAEARAAAARLALVDALVADERAQMLAEVAADLARGSTPAAEAFGHESTEQRNWVAELGLDQLE